MTYDFTSIIERSGRDALAVDMPAAGPAQEGVFPVPLQQYESPFHVRAFGSLYPGG